MSYIHRSLVRFRFARYFYPYCTLEHSVSLHCFLFYVAKGLPTGTKHTEKHPHTMLFLTGQIILILLFQFTFLNPWVKYHPPWMYMHHHFPSNMGNMKKTFIKTMSFRIYMYIYVYFSEYIWFKLFISHKNNCWIGA